jgi:hypothetical protein
MVRGGHEGDVDFHCSNVEKVKQHGPKAQAKFEGGLPSARSVTKPSNVLERGP